MTWPWPGVPRGITTYWPSITSRDTLKAILSPTFIFLLVTAVSALSQMSVLLGSMVPVTTSTGFSTMTGTAGVASTIVAGAAVSCATAGADTSIETAASAVEPLNFMKSPS